MRERRKGGNKERRCLGCLQLRRKEQLLRIATFAPECVIIDEAQKLGGRGAYLCPMADCLIASVKRRQWGRSLRQPIAEQTLTNLLRQLKRHTLWLTGDLQRLW